MTDRKDQVLIALEGCWREFIEEGGVRLLDGKDVGLCPFHDDTDPSFSVFVGEGAKHRFKCHGCGASGDLLDFHLQRTGLPFREGLQQLCERFGIEKPARPAARGEPTATYVYEDENGAPVFRVLRYDQAGGKTFIQQRWDGRAFAGGKGVMKGVRRVPYRLPNWKDSPYVFHVEGEKCVHALESIGAKATTSAGGSSNWHRHLTAFYSGKKVVIFPDMDQPGLTYAREVGEDVRRVAAAVKVLLLPGLAEKEDVADWIARGGSKEQLSELVRAAPTFDEWARGLPGPEISEPGAATPPAPTGEPGDNGLDHRTDLGNAARFLRDHGGDVRYCHPWHRWLEWDGSLWSGDATGSVMRRAKATVRQILTEASQVEDDEARKALVKHAFRSESNRAIQAILSLGASDVPVLPDDLDAGAWLLNCPNGTLDLRTGTLRPHRREDLITKTAGTAYDARADCPRFQAFLDEIFRGDPDLIRFVQKAFGYSLTADTREQVIFLHWGEGENGKSTLLEVVAAAAGAYALACPPETLLAKRTGEGVPNDVARLKGARYVTCAETGQGRWLNVERVKALTGQDRVSARFMRAEWFDFIPTHHIHLATNHRPRIADHTHSIWRRIRLIPYLWQVPPEQKDPDLPKRLLEELPGILAWLVDGCVLWLEEGLSPPEEVRAATEAYRAEQDPVGEWMEECCVKVDAAWTSVADLWKHFQGWLGEAGDHTKMNKTDFGAIVKGRGYAEGRRRVRGRSTRGYHGIGIIGDRADSQDVRERVRGVSEGRTQALDTLYPIDE